MHVYYPLLYRLQRFSICDISDRVLLHKASNCCHFQAIKDREFVVGGRQIDNTTFCRAVAAAGKPAGLSKGSRSDFLRDMQGTGWVMNRVDIQTVKVLTGNPTITTTPTYLPTDPKQGREAVAKPKLPAVKEMEEKMIPLRK